MGRDNQNSGRTPYGSKYSHYVVARGLDKNGNVIVEDSEDKRGSTRYSLADTLQNSTVRITTGRGKNNESLANKYISGVSAVTNSAISGMVYSAAKSLGVNFGSSSNNNTTDGTGVNVRGDAKAAIGKSYTATREGESVTLTMDEGGAEIYSLLVNECGCSTAAACGAIGNWVQECGGGTIENIKPVALKGYIAEGGGLMQWTLPWNDHPTWAKAHGFSDWEWAGQLAHVKEELTDGSNWSKSRIEKAASQIRSMGFNVANTVDEYKKLTKPDEAAVNFERGLEGSADFWGSVAASEAYKNIKYKHLYCFKRRLFALAVYGLVTGQSSGSGRGVDKLSTTGRAKDQINFANSGEIERQEKLAEIGQNNLWTAGVPADNTTANTNTNDKITSPDKLTSIDKLTPVSETVKEDATSTSTDNNNGIATGLLGLLGDYTKRLTKGIFGNFYDAIYGTETDNSTTASSDTTAAYNGNDVIYAAAMVFEALGKVHPEGTYNAGFFDITCRDGTKIDHVRCDCSGLMTAIIQYMGYYTYKSSQSEYTASYHGEGLSSSMSLSEIYDKDGNPVTDWEEISKSNCTGSNAKPGDIRFESGHTDMFVCYKNGSEWPKGFNAGSTNGILESYKAAEAFFNNNNSFPMDGSVGASTIRDATCTRAFRFKGRSASGRGKNVDKVDLARLNRRIRPKNYILDEQGNKMYLSELLRKKYNSLSKFGKGKFGRAEEDNTVVDETTFIGQQLPADKITVENTPGVSESDVTTTNTTETTSSQKPAATLISKLSKYAKDATKGVFGNFYDALYGTEQQETVSNNETVGTSGTLQNAIPYSTYAIWKQGWASRDGEPHWINKGWNTKTAISIGGQNIGEAGCSLCSTALMLVHAGVVQEADFDPGKFADDVNTRSECAGGCGTDAPMRHMCEYKGNNTMQYVDTYTNSFVGKSFDELFDFVLKSMQEGYFLIGHVTGHFCCIDYIDTANRVIYILDPGFRANCWYDGKNKPSCLNSTDIGYTMSNGPSGKAIHGVIRYRSSTTNPSCYILNGRRSFDSLHETGDAPNATIGGTTLSTTPASTAEDSAAFAAANTSEDGTGRGKHGRGNAATSYVGGPETRPGIVGDYDGTYAHRMKITSDKTSTGVLKSYDSISRNHTNSGRGNVYNNSNSPSTYVSNTGRGSIMGTDSTYTTQYGGDNLANILRLAAIIADNSNKIDDILAVLATIAVNTENTTTAIGNSNNKKIPNGSKNGLSALRTALNDNNSGEDIINAIYQIAKS
jgi:hypothetical protein